MCGGEGVGEEVGLAAADIRTLYGEVFCLCA